MQELEAILHLLRLQLLEAAQHLGHGQPELGPVAARALPPPAAPRRQLDPHADLGPDAHLLGRTRGTRPELGVFLDDRDDVAAHLVGEHRRLDELGVLEAVADDRRVVRGQRRHRQQLGLRPGLEAEAVGPAEIQDLLDHLPLLVDLDRIDADVAPLVRMLRRWPTGRRRGCPPAMAEDIAEPDEDRQVDAAQLQVIDELLEIDRLLGILRRVDEHVAGAADGEVALAPARDLVELVRVRDRPRLADAPWPRQPRRLRVHSNMINESQRM